MSDIRGKFVWYELVTTDPKATGPFYDKVIGWRCQMVPGVNPAYWTWMNGEQMTGGLMEIPVDPRNKAVPQWIPYVGTPDVDATAEQAVSLGARMAYPPTDIPNIGRFAVLHDPQGAPFGLHQRVPA